MTFRQPVNVAMVGCGTVSQLYYTPALKQLAAQRMLRVAALYDPDRSNLLEMGRLFPEARHVDGLDELPRENIDLAVVASPPRFHAQQSIELLAAGLSVLCEKPMATSVADARAMTKAAAAAPGVLAIGLFRRFFPAAQTIRRILSLGLLGQVTDVSLMEGGAFSWPVRSPSYFSLANGGGGVLADLGVHALDLLGWWFGPPEVLRYEDDAMGGIEVNCRLECRLPGEATALVRLSRDCELSNRYVLRGTRGWLTWTVNDPSRLQWGFAQTPLALDAELHRVDRLHPTPLVGEPAGDFGQTFTAQLVNVIAAMHGLAELQVPADEGMRSIDLIERSYSLRTLMDMPWLGEHEHIRARRLNETASASAGPAIDSDLHR